MDSSSNDRIKYVIIGVTVFSISHYFLSFLCCDLVIVSEFSFSFFLPQFLYLVNFNFIIILSIKLACV